ncbi:uncharacterized protein LOC118275261 isoform X2 [Spodoptera frugiperda]|uniref:Uncharacterized protein LOC118275261 isoform X2 n=1 Tax=Spodoptera frugiperda TaxID=7108 RepID=A0A9R0DRH6_SPOFR|nr:uncharacterized protein LOC118275261 isoform X2 [Spodoptera frugiperda]
MWCRTILTAVAITYVVCMLLLSGLQKEDLDANTLAKLRRYNVNIDDMNNEHHQECISNPYTTKRINSNIQVTSEVAITKLPTEAFKIPVSERRKFFYNIMYDENIPM